MVETGWKTLLNFWSPLEAAEKLLIPPLCLWKFHVTPPSNHHHQKICWVYNDVVPTCKGHCPCRLGPVGAVRSSGQSLREGPGVGAHRSSENPGVSNSKNGLYRESHTITLAIVWKIYHGTKKDLMFFFNASVACIINRTLRRHNTNEVKDSVTFLQTNISWLYHSSSGLWDCYQKWCKNSWKTVTIHSWRDSWLKKCEPGSGEKNFLDQF